MNRVLPSRLGNILRATEDSLELEHDESIEGYVIRYHDELPETIRSEHQEYRVRLDMYCCLVLVFAVLAAMAALLLRGRLWPAVGAAGGYVLFGWISYEAAVASGRGFGHVLAEVELFIGRKRQAEATSAADRGGRWRRLLRTFAS
jgi:hypothetical protein